MDQSLVVEKGLAQLNEAMSHALQGHPARQMGQESSDKTWSPGGGNGQSIPVFLPGESHGQRSLAHYSPWGYKEQDMTEETQHTHTLLQPSIQK